MALHHCKASVTPPGVHWLVGLALLAVSACSAPLHRTVSLHALEDTSPTEATPLGRLMLNQVEMPPGWHPMGPRLALGHIRSEDQWQALRVEQPDLGPCPDLRQGTVVALASRLGEPLSGRWPVRIERAQVQEGAILLTARFESGSYHPDGLTYLDLAYIPQGQQVLVVDINGVRYYLD